MIGSIAPTDAAWYQFLWGRGRDEVNFWKPSARRAFRAEPSSPFLFKLKAPYRAICGFGFFTKWTPLPDWLAWECFEEGNGCSSLDALREQMQRIREGMGYVAGAGPDMIGCILIANPVFFRPDELVPQPRDWPDTLQVPRRYDMASGEGRRVWDACLERVSGSLQVSENMKVVQGRYGSERLIRPRLGQGAFRVLVTDAYDRACAATEEHSLPALEAAHIRPFSKDGPHEVNNGLLLRSDVHRLFDQGYLTVTTQGRLHVGERLRADYRNGRSYYPLHGMQLRRPRSVQEEPSQEFLKWHNDRVFRG
jgi:putative restriction endonuclease